jgi:hypothetical protein
VSREEFKYKERWRSWSKEEFKYKESGRSWSKEEFKYKEGGRSWSKEEFKYKKSGRSWSRENFQKTKAVNYLVEEGDLARYKKSPLVGPLGLKGSQLRVQAVSSDCNLLWLEVKPIQIPIRIHSLSVTWPLAAPLVQMLSV